MIMYSDDKIKKLLQVAMEETPPGFTSNVMNRVEAMKYSAASQPLVSKKVKVAFLVTFLLLVTIIVVIAALTMKDSITITLPKLSGRDFYSFSLSIVGFWILVGLNRLLTNPFTNQPSM